MLRTQLHNPHFTQNYGHIQYYTSADFVLISFENDHNLKQNEDGATVIVHEQTLKGFAKFFLQ